MEAWGCQIDGEEVGTASTVEPVGVTVHRRACEEEDEGGGQRGGEGVGREVVARPASSS